MAKVRIHAPRAKIYRVLLDARAVVKWMVPTGMAGHVHEFDARKGGAIRISLAYDSPDAAGKTTAHSDTYHGHFVRLAPDEQVVEILELATDDPALRGEMAVAINLAERDGVTELVAVHDGLPPGLAPADNETDWRMSLSKLAELVEGE